MNKKRQDGDRCRQMHACRKLRLLLIIMMADDKDDDRKTQKRERERLKKKLARCVINAMRDSNGVCVRMTRMMLRIETIAIGGGGDCFGFVEFA